MTTVPVDGLRSVGIVVPDARETAQKYATVLRIREWRLRRYDAERLTNASAHGLLTDRQVLSATGVGECASGPVKFELLQPLGGWTTFHEVLNTRGEGIH